MLADDVETSAIMLSPTGPGTGLRGSPHVRRASARAAPLAADDAAGWSGRRRRGPRRSPIGWRRRSWTAERATPVPRGAHARRRRGRRGRVGAGDGPRRHRRPHRPSAPDAGCAPDRGGAGAEFPRSSWSLSWTTSPVAPAGRPEAVGFLAERPGPADLRLQARPDPGGGRGVHAPRAARAAAPPAGALESLYSGRESEVQDRLAYHFSRAGEPGGDRAPRSPGRRQPRAPRPRGGGRGGEGGPRARGAPAEAERAGEVRAHRPPRRLALFPRRARRERAPARRAGGRRRRRAGPRRRGLLPVLARAHAEPPRRPRRRPRGGRRTRSAPGRAATR